MTNTIQVIDHKGQRVLTTAQLAENYGTDGKTLSKNFERNKERYLSDKHFILLEGTDLKEFKANRQNDDTLKFASALHLWTKKGAWLHAKSLNTDEAWEAYEALVDDYYDKVEQLQQVQPQMSMMEMIAYMAQKAVDAEKLEAQRKLKEAEQDKKITEIEEKQNKYIEYLTDIPDRAAINLKIKELTRKRFNNKAEEARSEVYAIFEAKYGFNLAKRLKKKHDEMNAAQIEKKGKPFAESTLKATYNKMHLIEDLGCTKELYEVVVGMLLECNNNDLDVEAV